MTTTTASAVYGGGLGETAATVMVREEDGSAWPLPVGTWLAPPTAADESVLGRAVAPVLDVGCGPGRHVLALARLGVLAVGVDVAPAAVRLARDRGAAVIEASVFGQVPGAGRWGSALLLDGNIGIGGCPQSLLRRLGTLLAPGGIVLAELDPPGTPRRAGRVRLESGDTASAWFPWARVAADRIGDVAAAAGLTPGETWEHEGRWFACVARP